MNKNQARFAWTIAAATAVASLSLGVSAAAASAVPPSASTTSAAKADGLGENIPAPAAARGSSLTDGASLLIRWNPFCTGRTTWVLIFEFTIPARGVSHWCFAYPGTWNFPTTGLDQATYFCAGNNYGDIKVKWQGYVTVYPFGPGTRITWQPGSATLISLTIVDSYGSDSCLV